MNHGLDYEQDDHPGDDENDPLLRIIREQIAKGSDNWTGIEKMLVKKLSNLPVPIERLEYIISVIEAADYEMSVTDMLMPRLSLLQNELSTIDDKITCATLIGYYASQKSMRYDALDFLEEHYADGIDNNDKISALTLLLNDDRPFEISDEERFETHMRYFIEWRDYVAAGDQDLIAGCAFDVLKMGKCYNVFKTTLSNMVFEHVDQYPEALQRVAMIIGCNKTVHEDEFDDLATNSHEIDARYVPGISLCKWQGLFMQQCFKAIQQEGFKNTINFISHKMEKDYFSDELLTCYAQLSQIEDACDLKNHLTASKLNIELINADDFSPNSLVDLKKNVETYLGWAEDIYIKASESGDVRDYLPDVRSAWEKLVAISCRDAQTIEDQITISGYKDDFLNAVCGLDADGQMIDTSNEKMGVSARPVFCYARNQKAMNKIVYEALLAEKEIILDQRSAGMPEDKNSLENSGTSSDFFREKLEEKFLQGKNQILKIWYQPTADENEIDIVALLPMTLAIN